LAGLLLSDLLLERSNPWAELFDSTRIKPIAAVGRIAAENLDAAAWFVRDRVAGAVLPSADGVPRSAGRLVEIDGEKVAVYRDAQGELHALSPYCTHLGCIVHWNEAEESWDCPCHGGRYTPDGAVLSGPPTAPLEERSIPEPAASRS
jgi:Rieske Fe-S protein